MKHDREAQTIEALTICAMLRDQGWQKVRISVSRGGTYTVEAEAGEGPMKAKHDWRLR